MKESNLHIQNLPQKPTFIFDGNCSFCRKWIARWKAITEDQVDYLPFQEAQTLYPEIPQEALEKSVHWIEKTGEVCSGPEAVFKALSLATGSRKKWLKLYEKFALFRKASEKFYKLVANNRTFFSSFTRFFWGENLEPSSYFLTRWIFLRGLGLIYFIAFVSLGIQVLGLIGENGISPAKLFLKAVQEHFGGKVYNLLPTLGWINTSDVFLKFLCWGGAIASGLLILGIFPALMVFISWALYLSLTVLGQQFLSFQWDILLLETGFLAIFFAPFQILPRLSRESPPPKTILWLIRWCLFRLMFESGCVKLLSGDSCWKDLTALRFHYETQPLPTWIGWYFHQAPLWFQKISCATMFGVELIAPFFIFLPRRLRLIGFFLLTSLQILIALTGNYCFFNLLTFLLCLSLLDDASIRPFIPKFLRKQLYLQKRKSNFYRSFITLPLAFIIFSIGSIQVIQLFDKKFSLPSWVQKPIKWIDPFQIVNPYGLFAVMTKERPEIIIEGSDDGENWQAYEFKWKPGDLSQKPLFVAPHQPRLDWQMWFAALGNVRSNRWLLNFMARLLEGSPEVLKLLAKNPFPDTPPHYMRAELYDYHFTDLETKRKEGTWWTRERKGLYCPPISLRRE
ncbi:MAG: lipase maturation factor family protein [Chlamydiae bacterium]|nr:lipase maturation factor family protein [Chlamydiota bacterium]MBI3266843.1 lipase maturation factor family protein [Chlamydiota bacterium]